MKAIKVSVWGIVQGVGFRPFVYRLAKKYGLAGWVQNTSGSVEIEAEGNQTALRAFLNDLKSQIPPAARIEKVVTVFRQPEGYKSFEIRDSETEIGKYQPVSPDIATCRDCEKEIFNEKDRRYRYPFTNCTNCGPRFTIINGIPYDRPKTTMGKFKMCPHCRKEYEDPNDRRFPAPPNARPVFGPPMPIAEGAGEPGKWGAVFKKTGGAFYKGEENIKNRAGGVLLDILGPST